MHTSTVHFLVWLGLLGAIPAAAALRLQSRLPHLPAAMQLFAGPVILALVWVHGAVFDVPNNYAVLESGSMKSYAPDGQLLHSSEGMGFFQFWFSPHRGSEYGEHWALMAGLSLPVVVAVALGLLGRRRGWRTEPARPLHAAIGYLSWVLGALFLRHVTDLILDMAEHNSYAMSSLGRFIDTVGQELALALGLAVPPIALALRLARRPPAPGQR